LLECRSLTVRRFISQRMHHIVRAIARREHQQVDGATYFYGKVRRAMTFYVDRPITIRTLEATIRSRLAATVALGIIVLPIISACSKGGNSGTMVRPPSPVLIAKAVVRTVPNQLHEIGNVEAFATVNIKSRVEGELVAIHFHEGDFVEKGQLLFTLDSRPFAAALKLAEADLAKDQAQLVKADADDKRYSFLLQESVGSREEYDQAHATAGALRATVIADQAAVDTARLNLEYSQIRSPLDGRTGNLQSHIGDMIKADADTAMVTITQVQPIYVTFSVPEGELAAVRMNLETHPLEVDAAIPNSPEPLEHGTLAFIDNTVDKTTGTILLKGLFQNENRRLWPGQFVNATLTLNQIRNAVLVPSQAVQSGQNGLFIFVVDNQMQAHLRQITAGAQVGTDTIIERGIQPGETVVTDGQMLLAPGARVKIRSAL
jgi:membrane fusion protein, multidrug efflux system